MEEKIIVDNEIELRATDEHSAADEFKLLMRSRNHILPWLAWMHDYDNCSIEEGIKMREEYQASKALERKNKISFAYDIYYNGALAGSIELKDFSDVEHRCYIGYWISQDFTRKGIATRSVNALTELAFKTLDINCISAKIADKNFASQKIAKRCGFELEKIIPNYFLLEGIYHDCHIYSKFN